MDQREELRALVAGFRAHLEARGRSGLLGLPLAKPTTAIREDRRPPILPRASAGEGPAQRAEGDGALVASPVPSPVAAPEGADARPTGARGLALAREELGDCQRCRLKDERKQIVFGVGNAEADLVFVGEAPGADEDRVGEPFVGAAGQLLTKMIEAMGFGRDDVYICNVIKCRPPGNRNPEPDEVAACEPFLKKQLAALRPRMIVTLGKFAAHCLLRVDTPITRLRGNFRSYEGIQLMPTYHPAFLLRDPSRKREAWSDLQLVVAALRRMGIDPPNPTRA
jgi:uracil-DNA glycosylase family 4